MRSDTIKRNTTAELVIEKVLNMITDGEPKVGDRLPSAQKLAEIKRKLLSIQLSTTRTGSV